MTRARLLSLLAFVALLAACRGDITQATLLSGVDQPMVATGDDAYTLEEWGGGTFTHLDVTIENASPETTPRATDALNPYATVMATAIRVIMPGRRERISRTTPFRNGHPP